MRLFPRNKRPRSGTTTLPLDSDSIQCALSFIGFHASFLLRDSIQQYIIRWYDRGVYADIPFLNWLHLITIYIHFELRTLFIIYVTASLYNKCLRLVRRHYFSIPIGGACDIHLLGGIHPFLY